MTTKEWEKLIKRQCKKAGTYEVFYEDTIHTLAMLMEQRDRTYEKYVEDGSQPVREYTNKGGQTNIVKNPILVSWLEINAQALAYWRDLGLTPKGYRTLSGEKVSKNDESGGLADIIASLEN